MGGKTTISDYEVRGRDSHADVSDRRLHVNSELEGVNLVDNAITVSNVELFSVFHSMLRQLKILNTHLAMATDNEINEWEVDT